MTDHQHVNRHASPFGSDRFGRIAERLARFFGTPKYIVGQTLIVIAWIIYNVVTVTSGRFDPYPFILLNLGFSTQAAYAAPLILLAQTRQADRDKHATELDVKHREDLASEHSRLLAANTELTQRVADLAEQIHSLVCDK